MTETRAAPLTPPAEAKRYRVNGDFILREIAGEAILVPVGKAAERFNGMLSLNETFSFLWKQFREPRTIREAVQAVQANFDGTEEQIKKDVTDFVGESVRQGFLIEEDK